MGRVADPVGKAGEGRDPTAKGYSAADQVSRKLWAYPGNHVASAIDYLGDLGVQGFPDLLLGYDNGTWQGGNDTFAGNFQRRARRGLWMGAAQVIFNQLRSVRAHKEIISLSDVADDRLIHRVTSDWYRPGQDDISQGEDRNIRGARANVDDHMTFCLVDWLQGAKPGGAGLIQEVDFSSAGPVSDLLEGVLGDIRCIGRDTDEESWSAPAPAARGVSDEMRKQKPCHIKVNDGPIPEGLDDVDAERGSPKHVSRGLPDGFPIVKNLEGPLFYREDRWLFADDTLTPDTGSRGRCAKIDGRIGRKQPE